MGLLFRLQKEKSGDMMSKVPVSHLVILPTSSYLNNFRNLT